MQRGVVCKASRICIVWFHVDAHGGSWPVRRSPAGDWCGSVMLVGKGSSVLELQSSLRALLTLLKCNIGWDSFVWKGFALDQLENLAAMQGTAKDGIFVKEEELQSRCQRHLKYLVVIS